MRAQELSEARSLSGYRTPSATMMSLSQTSVVLTSAQRPSRETVPSRCTIPSLNRYKLRHQRPVLS